MKRFIKITICIFSVLFLNACTKEPEPSPSPIPVIKNTASGVFVVNEGNFQFGNSSLGYYGISSDKYTDDAFKNVNSRPLGDVFQSMEIIDNTAYLVVNNSGRIEIMDPSTFKSLGTISGFTSPRYILPVTNEIMYVSDLYSNSVQVVNLGSRTISAKISITGWTEEMVMYKTLAFVTNLKSEYLYVINVLDNSLQDSIRIGYGANSIKKDKSDKLWVVCGGDKAKGKKAGIYKINPFLKKVDLELVFSGTNDSPSKLEINATADTLYYLNNGVFRFHYKDNTLPAEAIIKSGTMNIYGLGLNPSDGSIYVADALDYVQKGTVFRYTKDGTLLGSFKSGTIPSGFKFY